VKGFGIFLGMLLLISSATQAQTKKSAREADSDQLGMSCTQILKMTSTDWVAKFTAAKAGKGPTETQSSEPPASPAAPEPEFTIRAIGVYGKCYDARTNHLAAALGRAGKGPLMGARGDFGDFEKALKDFEAAALANVQPPASEAKKAYAALYEKQFRYEFYLSYTPAAQAHTAPPSSAKQSSSSATTKSAPPASKAGPGESSSVRPSEEKSTSAAEEVGGPTSADDTDEQFTKAKNRFGQLLEALPEDNARAIHSAFGNMLGGYEVGQETRLNVYLYAIYLLEPESAKPFAAPPF
jgi:hypothetical protein